MDGWQWVVMGLVAWFVVAAAVSLAVGQLLRAADRRERRARSEGAEEPGHRRRNGDWPETG